MRGGDLTPLTGGALYPSTFKNAWFARPACCKPFPDAFRAGDIRAQRQKRRQRGVRLFAYCNCEGTRAKALFVLAGHASAGVSAALSPANMPGRNIRFHALVRRASCRYLFFVIKYMTIPAQTITAPTTIQKTGFMPQPPYKRELFLQNGRALARKVFRRAPSQFHWRSRFPAASIPLSPGALQTGAHLRQQRGRNGICLSNRLAHAAGQRSAVYPHFPAVRFAQRFTGFTGNPAQAWLSAQAFFPTMANMAAVHGEDESRVTAWRIGLPFQIAAPAFSGNSAWASCVCALAFRPLGRPAFVCDKPLQVPGDNI